MKLRRRFITFALLIHAVPLVLAILLYQHNKYFFVAAELLVVVSVIVTIRLYKSFLQPLNVLASGIESMKDQDFSTTFVKTGQEELDQLVDVYNRMIGQLRSERARQREQHYFLERLITATPTGVVILDLDDNISMLNPAACAFLEVGPDEIIGAPLKKFADGPWNELYRMQAGETRIVKFDGIQTYKCRKSHFLDRGFHRHFILIEQLTREILATQKQAYEKVIRMMSHEINNSVGAVNSILQSLLKVMGQLTAEDRQDFEEAIRVAINRNSGLNRFMGNFADVVRIPPPVQEPHDMHQLLHSVQTLMSAECERRNIGWVWELSSTPLKAHIDYQQIEQVLVNIIKNAIEAIGKDGTITIQTSTTNPKTMRIIDTGKGIPPEVKPRLFTPFYSTKRDGQGIGLTFIREVLISHGFDFGLEPTNDGRTVFWIRFDERGGSDK